MRNFRNIDTGEVWTEEEVRKSYEDFRYEIGDGSMEFEDYLDNLLDQGRQGIEGLVEI